MINKVDPNTIPEMSEYLRAKSMLEWFKQQHADRLNQYAEYVAAYNQAREAADKAVRAAGVSCDDFDLYQQVSKVDADKLLDMVGRETFIQCGGTLKSKKEAKIDARALKQAVAQGFITQEVHDEVVKVENKYHSPKEGILP